SEGRKVNLPDASVLIYGGVTSKKGSQFSAYIWRDHKFVARFCAYIWRANKRPGKTGRFFAYIWRGVILIRITIPCYIWRVPRGCSPKTVNAFVLIYGDPLDRPRAIVTKL